MEEAAIPSNTFTLQHLEQLISLIGSETRMLYRWMVNLYNETLRAISITVIISYPKTIHSWRVSENCGHFCFPCCSSLHEHREKVPCWKLVSQYTTVQYCTLLRRTIITKLEERWGHHSDGTQKSVVADTIIMPSCDRCHDNRLPKVLYVVLSWWMVTRRE